MRNVILMTLVGGLFALLTACGGPSSSEANTQANLKKMEDEVMHIHDVAMARMGDISKLRRAAKAEMEQPNDPDRAAQLQVLTQQLTAANDAMMGWMRDFKLPSREMTEAAAEEIEAYLQKEMKAIEAVDQEMLAAIKAGQEALPDVEISQAAAHDHSGHDHSGHDH